MELIIFFSTISRDCILKHFWFSFHEVSMNRGRWEDFRWKSQGQYWISSDIHTCMSLVVCTCMYLPTQPACTDRCKLKMDRRTVDKSNLSAA